MNSQLNESIEQARNGQYYLNSVHRQSSYNIQSLTNKKPQNSSFIMCSSMISTAQQQKTCDKPQKKNLKKIILNKLKKFRQRIVNGDQVNGTPTLHKMTNQKGDYFIDEQSCIVDKRNVFDISEVNSFVKTSTFRRHGSDGELYESFSSNEQESSETSDLFPESNLFLFNRSEEISHLFETAVENNNETNVISQAPSSSNLIGSSLLSKNLSNIQLNKENGQTSTPILQRRAIQESIIYEADMTMDESTQVQVDEPILIESTFDTSSCSNLSSDLIILQTGFSAKSTTPCVSSINRENMSYDLVDSVPEWAMGHQLQLAVVNQIYFQQNAPIFE